MMKLLATLLSLALLLSLTACTTPEPHETTVPSTSAAPLTSPPTETTTEAPTELDTEPEARPIVFDHIRLDGDEYVSIEPTEDGLFLESMFEGYPAAKIPYSFMINELSEDDFELYVYTPYIEGMRATVCDSPYSHAAHTYVLLTVPDGINVPELSEQILRDVNERRLICCIYESISVIYAENTILIAMGPEDLAYHMRDRFSGIMGSAEMSIRHTDVTVSE